MIFDIGLGASIIQNPRGDEAEFLNTAWTMGIIRGLFLWVIAILFSGKVAELYANEDLYWIFVVSSSSVAVFSFQSTNLSSLKRDLRNDILVTFEIVTHAITVASILVWAWISPDVWSLVGGGLVGAILRTFLSFALPGIANRLHWNRNDAKSLINFGKWIALSALVQLIGQNADRLILGKLVSLEDLGIYHVVSTWALMGKGLIGQLGYSVLFPAMAMKTALGRVEFLSRLQRPRFICLFFGAFLLSIAVAVSDLSLKLIYDDRFNRYPWILPTLLVGCWPFALTSTLEPALTAFGRTKYSFFFDLIRCTGVIFGIVIGHLVLGLWGVILGLVLSEYLRYLAVQFGLSRERLSVLHQDFQLTLAFTGFTGLLLLFRALLIGDTPWSSL